MTQPTVSKHKEESEQEKIHKKTQKITFKMNRLALVSSQETCKMHIYKHESHEPMW